jgi:hypothetical protein
MLDNEWTQLLTQLSKSRGSHTRFFCLVDTVSARNFAGTNDAHGWIGLQFQSQPGGPPNNILLHVNMRDPSNVLQQQAIGILGVNLIYAAFYEVQTQESFLEGLAQDVVAERIEIDYVDLGGPAFESWDRRALLVHLVRAGLAEPVFFSSNGSSVPPTEVLHKKAVVIHASSFTTEIKRARSLRVAVVCTVILVIFLAVAFAFVFLFLLVWLLSQEDIVSYRPIRRV